MTTAMKLTTGILAVGLMAGLGFAQTDDIDNARSMAKSLQQKQANDSNAALDAAGVGNPSKPAAGAPAPAVKPAVIPSAKPAASAPAAAPAAKPAPAPAAKPASGSAQLQKVNVVPASDSVQVEIVASQAVTPKVSKLSSPDRVLVELPGTTDVTPKNHIAVGSAGVKGIRIGHDGKTPPTTSVVVDLEKACAYELTPSSNGKIVLTLHTGSQAAKSTPAPAPKPAAQPTAAKNTTPAPKPQPAAVKPVAATASAAVVKPAVVATASAKQAPAKTETAKPAAKKQQAKDSKPAPAKAAVVANAGKKADAFKPKTEEKKAEETKPEEQKAADDKKEEKTEDKKWAMNGKRDPFFSPVVQQQGGSGCSTGKKCLEIGNINLRGVIKSDTGFIAVVTNSLNKAYFLRENDPVFNGYVVKITADTIVFQETLQDRLGKTFTREVVKKITTPAV